MVSWKLKAIDLITVVGENLKKNIAAEKKTSVKILSLLFRGLEMFVETRDSLQ